MSEYIEREAALEICETEYQARLRMCDYCGDTVAWNIGSEIKALPAADVAPVVHSYWEHKITSYGEIVSSCHNCKYPVSQFWGLTKYCPSCGARMDGGNDG